MNSKRILIKKKKTQKTKKQQNELKEDFNKLQNKPRRLYFKKEIKKTAQDRKEEFNKDMESLTRKKKRNPGNNKLLKSNKNLTERHSSRMEQAEGRISRFKHKIYIKEKNRHIHRQMNKSWKKNMQELCNSIKRPNLPVLGIKEGEEVQVKV
jgi:hypothetical protein